MNENVELSAFKDELMLPYPNNSSNFPTIFSKFDLRSESLSVNRIICNKTDEFVRGFQNDKNITENA